MRVKHRTQIFKFRSAHSKLSQKLFARHVSDGPASAFSGYLADLREGHGPIQYVQIVLSRVRVYVLTYVRTYIHTHRLLSYSRQRALTATSKCHTGIVYVGFVVGAVALGTVYCRVLQLTQSVIPPCSTVTYHQGMVKQQQVRTQF